MYTNDECKRAQLNMSSYTERKL